MPLNIENAESAFLGGFARFEEWKEKFEGKWFAPIGEMQRDLLLKSLPEPVKVELRKRAPGGMEVLESRMENGESRMGGKRGRGEQGKRGRGEKEKSGGGGFRFGGDVDEEYMS